MDSKTLSEQDIRSKFIAPALHAAGWDALRQVREEVQLTAGRVLVRGKLTGRARTRPSRQNCSRGPSTRCGRGTS